MDINETLLSCVFSSIPIVDLFRCYMINLCSKSKQKERIIFIKQREELVTAQSVLGIKVGNQMLLIFMTLLNIILRWKYHYTGEGEATSLDRNLTLIVIHLALLFAWMQYLFLMLYDYLSYGKTTINTQITYGIGFVCQITLCLTVFTSGQSDDIICLAGSYTQSGLFFTSFIVLVIFPNDCVIKNVIITEYRFNNPSLGEQLLSKSLVKSAFTFNNKESVLSFSNSNQFPHPQVTIDDNIIKDITIYTFKESQKYQKRTIIYQIDYKLNNQQKKVYRSFREFLSFHSDLRHDCPDQILPLFPNKRGQNKYLSMEDIQQRQELLDQFLKGILVRFNTHPYFRQFLNSQNDTLQYKQKFLPNVKKMYTIKPYILDRECHQFKEQCPIPRILLALLFLRRFGRECQRMKRVLGTREDREDSNVLRRGFQTSHLRSEVLNPYHVLSMTMITNKSSIK